MRRGVEIVIVASCIAVACGDDSSSSNVDAAPDPAIDASAGIDASCQPAPFTDDAIVLRRQDDEDAVFLRTSNGDGTFAAAQKIHPGVNDGSLDDPMIGDFDGDGSLDILGTDDVIYLLRYDSCTDTWTESAASSWPDRILGAGDFDGDGDLDIYGFSILGGGTNEVVLLNNGDGTFEIDEDALDLSGITTGMQMWGSAHAEDVSGDGIADFVVTLHTGETSAEIYMVPGDGDGTFGAPVSIGTVSVAGNGIDLGDVDGDGDADVLVGLDDDGDPGQVFLLRNDPDGDGFAAAEQALDPAPSAESGSDQRGFGNLRLYDWNGDGRDDALVSVRDAPGDSEHEVLVYLASDGGAFDTEPIVIQDTTIGRSLRIGVPTR